MIHSNDENVKTYLSVCWLVLYHMPSNLFCMTPRNAKPKQVESRMRHVRTSHMYDAEMMCVTVMMLPTRIGCHWGEGGFDAVDIIVIQIRKAWMVVAVSESPLSLSNYTRFITNFCFCCPRTTNNHVSFINDPLRLVCPMLLLLASHCHNSLCSDTFIVIGNDYYEGDGFKTHVATTTSP